MDRYTKLWVKKELKNIFSFLFWSNRHIDFKTLLIPKKNLFTTTKNIFTIRERTNSSICRHPFSIILSLVLGNLKPVPNFRFEIYIKITAKNNDAMINKTEPWQL